ncbi:MAG TPA: EthD family reductase [Mycobacteriales bacterium]|nr:EthD family reductase [Mycobacteriales bacterium]
MTVKMTVVYGTPDDPAKFQQHYFDVHVPLCHKLPGLQRIEVAKVTGGPMGTPSPYHLVTELYFSDQASLDAAMGSEAGADTGKDFMAIAPQGSFMTVADIVD